MRGSGRAPWSRRYLCTLWKLFRPAVQQHGPLVGQVHVDAVGGEVVGHGQFVVAVVAHLLHDLSRQETVTRARREQRAHGTFRDMKRRFCAPLKMPFMCTATTAKSVPGFFSADQTILGWGGGGGVERVGLMKNAGAEKHSSPTDVILFM